MVGGSSEHKWLPVIAPLFARPIASCTYQGQVVAAPLRTDLGVLYYRTDIVPTPQRLWTL